MCVAAFRRRALCVLAGAWLPIQGGRGFLTVHGAAGPAWRGDGLDCGGVLALPVSRLAAFW
jgi:hypothetical protein